jgi:hypothetical protein
MCYVPQFIFLSVILHREHVTIHLKIKQVTQSPVLKEFQV